MEGLTQIMKQLKEIAALLSVVRDDRYLSVFAPKECFWYEPGTGRNLFHPTFQDYALVKNYIRFLESVHLQMDYTRND